MQIRTLSDIMFVAVLVAGALTATATAQQPNTPAHTMTFNNFDPGTYPIQAVVFTPSSLHIHISGASSAIGSPFVLVQASDLVSPGFIVTPSEIVDIDLLTMSAIMDGTRPWASPLNLFAVLDMAGEATISLPIVGQVAAPITLGAFQTAILDPGSALGLTLTAATKLTLEGQSSFGTIEYSRGSDTSHHADFFTSAPNSSVPNTQMPVDYDVRVQNLAGFQPVSYSGSHPWWRKDFANLPAGLTAMNVRENTTFPHFKTSYGDVYCFRDHTVSPSQFGYAIKSATGMAPLPGSMTVGTYGGMYTPFDPEIQIQGNRLAVVIDPATGADSCFLVSLDGPTLFGGVDSVSLGSGGQTGVVDESLTFTHNNLFCVCDTSATASTGLLFSAPNDGSLPLSSVTVPGGPSMSGLPVTEVDCEIRYSDDRAIAVFQAGTSTTNEDLYLITDTAPGAYTITNLSLYPTPRTIEEFGDDSSGFSNQVAISPGNTRIAFIEYTGYPDYDDELMIVDIATPGILTHVTGPANFDITHDDCYELHWADDDTLLFFCGTSVSATDLFSYQVPTGTLTNLTETSGVLSPPFSGSPMVNPDVVFFNIGRTHMFFQNYGGTDASGNHTNNLIGLELSTLTLIDITGSEFAGGTTPDADTTASSPQWLHFHFARNSDMCVFISELAVGTDENVWAFDGSAPGPAVLLTNNPGSNYKTVDNLSLDDSGLSVAFGDNVSGAHELLYLAQTTIPGSATVIYNPPPSIVSGNLTDGSPRWAPNGNLLFCYGDSNPTNPTDAILMLWDSGLGITTLDATTGSYWIY